MSLVIRRLRAQEWPMLRDLRLAALADAPAAFGQPLKDAAAMPEAEWKATARNSGEGDRRAWFIGLLDERPVGLVQARRRAPHDCLVFSMWVAPEARRAGVGRRLLSMVEEWAAGWGARRIVLWVVEGNGGAQRFYERIGFGLIEDGPDSSSGALYGALAMERPL
jgi:GNAT superfamily N-acetyltransferase